MNTKQEFIGRPTSDNRNVDNETRVSSKRPRETDLGYARRIADTKRDQLREAAERVLNDNAWDLDRNTQSGCILISLDALRQLRTAVQS